MKPTLFLWMEPKMFKKYLLGIVLLILVAFAAFSIYIKLHPKKLPPYLIAGVGRIDGDLVNINTKYPGRIQKVYKNEGDPVQKGELLATLDAKEYQAKERALEAQMEAKKKALQAKEVALTIVKKTLPKNVQKALAQKKAKEAMLSELEKSIATLQALVRQDKKDLQRLQNLLAQHLIDRHKVEEASLKLTSDANKLKALLAKKKEVLAAIDAAKATLAQAKSALLRIDALRLELEALQKGIAALRAQKDAIATIIDEFSIRSPLNGYIVDQVAYAGEVLGSGMTILTALDPRTLYLKIYVDTMQNGKIALGDKAAIFLDAYPNRPIAAKVVHIAKKCEFTPKEVAVRSDRIQRVYAVHLRPLKPNPLLKLGLPAIGIITTKNSGLPKSLDEVPPL